MTDVLQTPRLHLRPFTAADAPAMFRLGNDPVVMRYIGSPPMQSEDEALAYLQSHPLADYQRTGYGRLAMVWPATGEIIGFCGLKWVDEINGFDLGYRLLQPYWGQGLAFEAAVAVLADTKLRPFKCPHGSAQQQIFGLVHPDNQGSIRVLEKLGFVYLQDIVFSLLPDLAVRQYGLTLGSVTIPSTFSTNSGA
ncbi:GNAT family N-acetyltransferase [Rheinheimera texasensis]|uniref:GNAT family N-acetyltransferase n=1 Tax=Rheinheimera texasensis TaxID=306205 RepID=UPI0032B1CF0D